MTRRNAVAVAAGGATAALTLSLVVGGYFTDEPLEESGRFVKNPVDLVEPSTNMNLDREVPEPSDPDTIVGVDESSVQGISYLGPKCGTMKIRQGTTVGEGSLIVRGSESRANSYSVENTVDSEDFRDNFESSKKSIPIEASREVPGDTFGRLTVYPLYDTYQFSVGESAAAGSAAVFVGYCYELTTQDIESGES